MAPDSRLNAKVVFPTALAVTCFGANSVLCRLALATNAIDPASFTSVRIVSGAVVLGVIGLSKDRRMSSLGEGSWISGLLLVIYAAAFSSAYVGMSTGTGALILFGVVQATMILSAVLSGNRPSAAELTGLVLALSGLVYLLLPGMGFTPLGYAGLMLIAGVAWGLYSVRGRSCHKPIEATAGNFLRAAPLAGLIALASISHLHAAPKGVLLGIASGGITSGLGYAVWYAVVPGLGATRAAIVQLLVPILTALAGILLLGEAPSLRLAIAAVATLSGVAMAVFGKR